ncbi:hypothetical protein MBLNU230_g2757t1 [Neophaeotheca triangularis]
MPPQSRGPPKPYGLQSKSTPNLPTLRSLRELREASNGPESPATIHTGAPGSPDIITSPSETASLDGFKLDASTQQDDSEDSASSSYASEEEESEKRTGQVSSLPSKRPIYHHQHSRSHTYLAPSAFAPPFYNRPPTPLPPSPSLTSLLRPTFSSSQNLSRPTTPDPSSDEGTNTTTHRHPKPPKPTPAATNTTTTTPTPTPGAQTPTSSTTAAFKTLTTTYTSHPHPVPRASPRVPTYEYYGFALYLLSSVLYTIYNLWAFLPSPFLHQLGIHYYPNRWWALAIPAWAVMGVVWIYVALGSYNSGLLTLGLGEVGVLVDEAGVVGVVDGRGGLVRRRDGGKGRGSGRGKNGGVGRRSRRASLDERAVESGPVAGVDWRELWNEGTDAVMDIPVGGVCEILYGTYDDDDEDDDDDNDDNDDDDDRRNERADVHGLGIGLGRSGVTDSASAVE